jgi:hypothetical protein
MGCVRTALQKACGILPGVREFLRAGDTRRGLPAVKEPFENVSLELTGDLR